MPKLLGCYEFELHPHILAAAGRGYDAVINVGAAEGYYAVGLARLMPEARVYAYDTNAASHPVCRSVAETQRCGGPRRSRQHVPWRGLRRASPGGGRWWCAISRAPRQTCSIPARYPALQAMDLIVELHDSPQAKPSVLIPERFGATHAVTLVRHGGRAVALPALFEPLGHLDQLLAVWEWRSGPTPWAVMQARTEAKP